MGGLRSLAVCYLAAATLFAVAASLPPHRLTGAALAGHLRQGLDFGLKQVARIDDLFQPSRRINLAPPGPNDVRTLAHATVPPRPATPIEPREAFDAPLSVIIAPDLPRIAAPARAGSGTLAAAAPSGTDDSTLAPAERLAVAARLKESLSSEMLKNFSLFLYVSTAPRGPLAQRLYVFRKDGGGHLVLAHDWAASTGRERYEISPSGKRTRTDTPSGYYELDPSRMYVKYHSANWDQPMPYSMFFNWEKNGEETGLAIHGAVGDDIAKLGTRASAGCVHLSPAHARELYDLIRSQYRGQVPRFAFNPATETMSNRGELMHGKDGKLKMAAGYQVLIVIENYAGGNMVAALD